MNSNRLASPDARSVREIPRVAAIKRRNIFQCLAMVPKGAKIVSTATSGDRIVVTVDVGGSVEIRTYDLHSLQAKGRLRFANEP